MIISRCFHRNTFSAFILAGLLILSLAPFQTIKAQSGTTISGTNQCANTLVYMSCPDCLTCATQTACQGCGVYICASTTIPSCMTCGSCAGASNCMFFSIRNVTTCDIIIDKVTVKFKRFNSSTSKWIICKPLKNFGTDCFTTEWTMTPTAPLIGTVDNCNNWPSGYTSCTEETAVFTPPSPNAITSPTCHGLVCTTGNTTFNDDHWYIYRGDHFSFTLCGADDGSNCTDDGTDGDVAGIDLELEWNDGINLPWTVAYTGITASSGCSVVCP